MRSPLILLALLSVSVVACKPNMDRELKLLKEEREKLEATRLELEKTMEKLEPLVAMAKLMDSTGMLGTMDELDMDELDAQLDSTLKELEEMEKKLEEDMDSFNESFEDLGDVPANPFEDEVDLSKVVEKVSDARYRLNRAELEKVLENPVQLARGARIVPSLIEGKPSGFKLYAVRPNSLFSLMGLENGDTIHSANGMDLSSPDKALAAYEKLKKAKKLVLEVTRRGEKIALHYQIQ